MNSEEKPKPEPEEMDMNQEQVDQKNQNEPEMEPAPETQEPEEPVEMVEIPKTRLEELENQESKFMEDLKRERAEGINYRKRLQKQRDEFAEIASAQILTRVLNVFDDLNRVIENANGEIPEKHFEGIGLVKQRLQGIFDQEGVALIKIEEGKTKYDPREMEAVVSQPIDGVEPNLVMGLISQGFKKGERILRPAKVMISKALSPPKEEAKPETNDEIPSEKPQSDDTVNENKTN